MFRFWWGCPQGLREVHEKGPGASGSGGEGEKKEGEGGDAGAGARAAGQQGKESQDDKKGTQLDETKWDDETRAYIKRLRDESAGHRTKNKELTSVLKSEKDRTKAILEAAGIQFEEDKPEEKIKALTAESQTLAFRNAILESAVQNGIMGDDLEFYEFLIAKATGDLEEGEELTDESLTAIVAKVKKASGKSANSSVGAGGKGGGGTPPPGDSKEISLDRFVRMTMMEKSELYAKNPELYKTLIAEARSKKKLV